MLGSLGRQTLTVSDTATRAIVGGTVVTVMTAPVASSLVVTGFPTSINGGQPGSFTVTARDATGNTLTGYRGTVHFVSSDPQAQLPADYTFTAADNGVHMFTATLNTIGTQAVTALDPTVRIAGTQSGIQVAKPAPPAVTGATVTPTATVTFSAVPRFDGTDDYIQAPSSLVVGGAITVEAWVKSANVLANWARVIDFANGPNLDNIIFGWMANTGHLYFETYRNGQTIALVTPAVFSQNQWVHVTAVNDGNGIGYIYINGALVVTGPQLVPATVVRTQQYVGRSNYAADAFFSGSIEDLHIWNSARSASQIQADMNQVTGGEPGLLLDYPLDEGEGATAFDRTTNHYNGTLTSTVAGDQPAWVADPGPGSGRVVASFTSANPSATAANFTAQITWGDGHQSAGTLTPNGRGGFNVTGSNTYAQPGTYPITVVVTDTFNGMGTGHGTANVGAPVTHFVVSGFPSAIVAGTAATFTLTAQDDLGRTFAGYRGTVHFTSSDPLAALPADYTFTAADNGRAVFPAALLTAGVQSITAADTQTASVLGTQAGIVVRPAAASGLAVSGFPSPTTAGVVQSFTVTARDRYGNIATGYRGTVHFTSSDPQAQLPPDYTFTTADNGAHTFMAALKTAGTQGITATDTARASFTATQGGIVVNPAATSALQVSDFPSPVTAGSPAAVLVTAVDAYGNVTPGYTGTVHLSSSDPQAVLEADHTFTAADNGRYAFGATLFTAGSQSITATDTADATITGTQADILVNATAAATLVLSGFPSPTAAGTPGTFTVTAYDAYGNVASGYADTITFYSTDSQAQLPDDYTFTAADNGVHTFTATLFTAGAQALGAVDGNNPDLVGEQDGIAVTPGPVSVLVVAGFPSPVVAGTEGTFTVIAQDAYGNQVADFNGRVAFFSSDSQAALPAGYTFTPGDQGAHTFTATLFTAGTQSIGAVDVNDPNVAGGQDGIEVDPAPATAFIVSDFPSPVPAGMPGQFTVTAVDPYGNIDVNYTGTVHFSAPSDPQAVLPPDYAFTADDAGTHVLTATLFTPGTQSLVASDVDNPDITGEQDGIIVDGGAAARGGHGLRIAGDSDLAPALLGPAVTPAVSRAVVASATATGPGTAESPRPPVRAVHGGNRQPVVGAFVAAAASGANAHSDEVVDLALAGWDDSMDHGLLLDERLLPW